MLTNNLVKKREGVVEGLIPQCTLWGQGSDISQKSLASFQKKLKVATLNGDQIRRMSFDEQ